MLITPKKRTVCSDKLLTVLFGDPKENRTPDSALRGRRLDRLTIGPFVMR